ncbi:DUF3313 domain-containing protein [Pseudomonas sp. CrR25]|nr:DUF3313 domain-containing protein [Pseudomonas sp. CrR25]
MKSTPFILSATLASLVFVAGCTAHTATEQQYSGFLSSYTGLDKVQTPSGNTVLRWVDPSFKAANYSGMVYHPVAFYPTPTASSRVSQNTLQELLDYTNQRLSSAMAQRLPLTSSPGPRTLAFRGAITGVGAEDQGLKPYEVVPVALVFAGAMAAAGERDQNSELFLEAELIDMASGKPVVRVVRKGLGAVLKNDSQAVTVEDLKGVIDAMAEDIVRFP